MLRYLGRRALRAVVTLWFAVTVTFFLVRLLPGDPALAVADPTMTEESRRELLAGYGLDDPLLVQYLRFLAQLARGDLGLSFRESVPVSAILAERLPWTLLLTGSALLVTLLVGVPLGVLAATRAGTPLDRMVQAGGAVGQSLFVPSVGVLLLHVLGLGLGWFPVGGAVDPDTTGLSAYASLLHHLVLPCLSLVLVQLGGYVLTLRATLVEALGEAYCALARAKGVPERTVVWRHALRNALPPTTTLAGLQLGFLVGGAVLTETIYAYPGVGRAVYDSVERLDYPVLQGAFLALALTVVVANLVTDVAHGILDPRVRAS